MSIGWPETLVLYRTRPIPRRQVGSGRRAGRVRYSCLKEAACGRGDSMGFESILVSKALPDREFRQNPIIDAHRYMTFSATMCLILPPAPSVLQEGSSDACAIHAKASAAKRLRSNGLRGDVVAGCQHRADLLGEPTYGESEGRTATKAFRKRDLPTDQAQAQQPEWDVPQWGCSGFRNPSTAR
jgi:hypothetical protein